MKIQSGIDRVSHSLDKSCSFEHVINDVFFLVLGDPRLDHGVTAITIRSWKITLNLVPGDNDIGQLYQHFLYPGVDPRRTLNIIYGHIVLFERPRVRNRNVELISMGSNRIIFVRRSDNIFRYYSFLSSSFRASSVKLIYPFVI